MSRVGGSPAARLRSSSTACTAQRGTHLKTLVTNVPLGASTSVAILSASSTSQDWE